MPYLAERGDGVILNLLVQPRASRNQLMGVQGEELKVRLTSPPVEGAANALCIEYFAKLFRLPKSRLSLVAGERSRHKRLLIEGLSAAEMRRLLADELPD